MKKIIIASFAVLTAAGIAFATALTGNTGTPSRSGQQVALLQASNHIYAGAMVAVSTSTGLAAPASDSANQHVVGRASAESDNTGPNYSASRRIGVDRGVFRWVNGGSFTNTDIGSFAYALDDQTVFTAAMATNDSPAGLIVQIDDGGVWVDTYAVGGSGAASLSTLTTSGNASIGGTLAVTGASTLTGALSVNGSVTSTNIGASTIVGQLTYTPTQTVYTAAAVANTNAVVPAQGIAVRVNNTNYVLKLYPIIGP